MAFLLSIVGIIGHVRTCGQSGSRSAARTCRVRGASGQPGPHRVLSQILVRRRLAASLSSADSGGQQVSIEIKGSHFERDVILWEVRWYVAYPICYRLLEEMMEEHGVEVDHSTLNRWVLKYAPLLEREFHARKRSVGRSWRMDETYVKVKGVWKYLYRAVDKAGATVDFLLTAKRDHKAALRFLRKAFDQHGTPEKITIGKSRANTAAIESYTAVHTAGIEIRHVKYLNNIVDQDHRAVKQAVRPMLGFKSFRAAAATLSGIELMHMIRKGQMRTTGELRPARQFYSLAE
jgi:putative transposase